MSVKNLPSDTCNVAYAVKIIGGKWKIYILWQLLGKRMRFSEIHRAVPGISEPVLIVQLKELQKDGVVRRIDFKTVPPHVEYELTPLGQSLDIVLEKLQAWGSHHRHTTES